MGGIAFNKPIGTYDLNTPRMPPGTYRRIRDRCHALLRRRFLAVASPIDAPRKADYGDVDIFVTWDTQAHTDDDGAACCADQEREAGAGNDANADLPWIVDFDDGGLRLVGASSTGISTLAFADPSPAERAMLRSVGEMLGAAYTKLDRLVNVSAQYAILVS
jgi:hypothetical protein